MMKKCLTVMLWLLWLFPLALQGQIKISEVQYHGTDMVELTNQGFSTVDVSSYWLCSFPVYNQIQNLTIVSGNTNLGPGEYLVIAGHAMGVDDELGLYTTNSFANFQAIVDYVEWGSTPHTRSAVAQWAGVWVPNGQFVPQVPMGSSIEYDGNGNTPQDYGQPAQPTFGMLNTNQDCDGGTVGADLGLEFGICVNAMSDPFVMNHMTQRPNAEYAYIVTDTFNNVLAFPPGDTLDLVGAGIGICRVWGISYTGTLPTTINVPLDSVSTDSCFSFSSNFVTVNRQVPDGGTVASPLGDTLGACAGDVIVPVSHTTAATALSYWYIITDSSDNILAWSTGDTLDLSSAPPGECHIWGWSYRGLPNPVMGQSIATLNDDPCEEISSNFITVIRQEPDGGLVASPLGDTIGACAGDVIVPVSHTTTATFLSYWYIITDANDNILAWSTNDTLDLSSAPPGECHIWGWSYKGLPDPIVGQNISTLNDDPCEEISGNFVTVFRQIPDGGMVASSLGDTVGACAGNVIIPVSHTTTATALSYWYIITDVNDSILAWSTNDTLDLSGAPAGECHIWGWSYRGLPDPIVGDHISTLNDDSCEEISSNFVTVLRQVPDGGTVASILGDSIGACAGDVIIPVSHTTTASALSYWYIITDANDSILDWSTNDTLDLSAAPAGECHIWGWSYSGLPNPVVGDHISTLNDDSCEEISSNFITVIRQIPDGGTVASPLGDTIGACVGNVIVPVSHITTANELSYWYIITDNNDNILAWSTNDTLDLSAAPAGECHIWGWSYRGLPNPVVGQNISTLNDDPCEEISSNFVTVIREVPDGGTVFSVLGDSIGACVGDVIIPVGHVTTANALSYWYIITDVNDSILAWSTNDTLDLSGAPAGECHIWGWSYRGLPDPIVGDHISTLNDDSCEEISTNFVTVIRQVPDGGMVASVLGDSIGACAGDVFIPVNHTTTATALSYWYIITDANDSILAWSTNDTLDLSGAPAGECHIWGWSYSGLPDPIVGDHISTLNDDDCEEISSNFVTVVRQVPDGGLINSNMGLNVTIVVDAIPDTILVSHITTATELSYWYIITDTSDQILGWSTSPAIDLNGAGVGVCRIWGWSYRGLPDPIVGEPLSTLMDDDCESVSANFVEVERVLPTGIEDGLLTSEVTVYPNPFTNVIRIRLDGLSSVKVYNIRGELILTKRERPEHLEVNQLSAGVYHLLLETVDGRFAVEKVIKR